MAWICVVCATRRRSESYRLVWAVTVVRPRFSGTATARTVPPVTGRNIWLVEVIVAVIAPAGSPRNVTSAPAVSARDIRTPPCMMPPAVHRCGAQTNRAITSSGLAWSTISPRCWANGISAASAPGGPESADMRQSLARQTMATACARGSPWRWVATAIGSISLVTDVTYKCDDCFICWLAAGQRVHRGGGGDAARAGVAQATLARGAVSAAVGVLVARPRRRRAGGAPAG